MFWLLAGPPEESPAAEAADGAVVGEVAGVVRGSIVANGTDGEIGNLRQTTLDKSLFLIVEKPSKTSEASDTTEASWVSEATYM